MKCLTLNKHWKINQEYNLDKLLYLLIDRPDEITFFGSFIWLFNQNLTHRDYVLPAILWPDGDVVWFKNGRHIKTECI